jgi:hypothetical protein
VGTSFGTFPVLASVLYRGIMWPLGLNSEYVFFDAGIE